MHLLYCVWAAPPVPSPHPHILAPLNPQHSKLHSTGSCAVPGVFCLHVYFLNKSYMSGKEPGESEGVLNRIGVSFTYSANSAECFLVN